MTAGLVVTGQYKALISSVDFKTCARQNKTHRVCKIRNSEVCNRCTGQYRGNAFGGLSPSGKRLDHPVLRGK